MPIIEVYTPHPAPSVEICHQLVLGLANDLGAAPSNTILNWQAIGQGDRLQRNGACANGPFVRLNCRRIYGEERIGLALTRFVNHISEVLKVPVEDVVAIVERKESGEVFINGAIYKEESKVQNKIELRPIGFVSTKRTKPEDDFWGDTVSEIRVLPEFVSKDALAGLQDFSHLEVIYHFHLVPESDVVPGSRHPRGNESFPKVGIFSQRGKDRPNRLGVSRCEILKVEGDRILVRGLDAIDGTPVIDLKPYMEEFAPRGKVRQPAWTREVMKDYYKAEGEK